MNPITPNLEPQPSTQPRKVVTGGSLQSRNKASNDDSLIADRGRYFSVVYAASKRFRLLTTSILAPKLQIRMTF